jgi:hypothetical protein
MNALRERTRRLARPVGVVLLAISAIAWLAIAALPFLPLAWETRAWLAGMLIIVGEIAFYFGALLLGHRLLAKLKAWARRKTGEH